MKAASGKIALLVVMIGLFGAFLVFDFDRFLTLGYLKEQQGVFRDYYQAHRFGALLTYFLSYILVTALSLPGATVMTLAGGALFGFWPALAVVSFASTIGATLAMLAARFLLRNCVQRKFGDRLKTINAGIEQEGAFYLFSLRLVPLFPFFLINLAMGLTPLRASTFYWVSQVGMLAGTAVYVNAGTRLGELESAAGVLSPPLLLSFALLGLFPLGARLCMRKRFLQRLLAWFERIRSRRSG